MPAQPGSAFKPFVYLTAIERGYTPDSVIEDAPISIKGWQPKNYEGGYMGPVTLTTALAKSLNTVAARLAARGRPLQRGEHGPADSASYLPCTKNPSIALGTAEVDAARDHVGLRALRERRLRRAALRDRHDQDKSGKVLFRRQGDGVGRVIQPAAVGTIKPHAGDRGRTGHRHPGDHPGRPVGGKTGTSQDFRDAWFIGFVKRLTTGFGSATTDNSPTR